MAAGGEALRRVHRVSARSPRRDRAPLGTRQERRGAPGGGRPRLADLGGELLSGDTVRVPATAEAGKTARERKTRSASVVEPFIITAAEARARDAGQQSSDPRLPAPPGLQRAQEAFISLGAAPARCAASVFFLSPRVAGGPLGSRRWRRGAPMASEGLFSRRRPTVLGRGLRGRLGRGLRLGF